MTARQIDAEILTVWYNLYDASVTAVKTYVDSNQGPVSRPSITPFANGEFVIIMSQHSDGGQPGRDTPPSERDRVTVNLNRAERQIVSRRASNSAKVAFQVGLNNDHAALFHDGNGRELVNSEEASEILLDGMLFPDLTF